MVTIRRPGRVIRVSGSERPPRLPLRWAIIAIVTASGGVIAYDAGGVIAALTVMAAIAVAAHQLIA